jgi:tRNA(Phe) wybutosine-synthesizing methylase Tyw3
MLLIVSYSCAGRCFLYCGDGIKSWHNNSNNNTEGENGDVGNNNDESGKKKLGFFQRYRVNHDLVNEPQRYFNLTTLIGGQDLTGGGDPIPTIGQFEGHQNNAHFKEKLEDDSALSFTTPIWLRYEPFILHVMCRSLKAASVLMALARPSFKNVGLTSWNSDSKGHDGEDEVNTTTTVNNQQCKGGGPRYLVAIWGDEGVDMPLSLPTSPEIGLYYDPKNEASTACNADWLSQLVNERHCRNWKKIDRFTEEVRSLDEGPVDVTVENTIDGVVHGINRVELDVNIGNGSQSNRSATELTIPRSYDGERI